jgi:hypothetical protein
MTNTQRSDVILREPKRLKVLALKHAYSSVVWYYSAKSSLLEHGEHK